MKKLSIFACFLLLCCMTLLTACSSSPAEQAVGHWKYDLGGGSRVDVIINDDASTGEMNISGPDSNDRNILYARQSFTIEEDGNTLILHFDDGTNGSIIVDDNGNVCTPDGDRYTKI